MSFSPPGAANSAPPNLLTEFNGPHRRGKNREREEREGKEKEGKGQEKTPPLK